MKRALFAMGALLMVMDIVLAQPYPSRSITMVVPFGAGGPTDALARILTQRMSVTLGVKLAGLGQDIPPPETQTSEALGRFYKAEIAKWWPVIREAGIKVE